MSRYNTVKRVLNIVATSYFGKETWIFVNIVFTSQRYTSTSAHTPLTSVVTTQNELYIDHPNNCRMVVLQSSMIMFYCHSFLNHIATHVFTIPTIIPVIKDSRATLGVLMQSNLQFRHIFVVLHRSTTV